MEVTSGTPAITFRDEGEAAAYARQLVEAIRLGYVTRGTHPPLLLLESASGLNRLIRGSAGGSGQTASSVPLPGTSEPASSPDPQPCNQPVLTAKEAARYAEVSAEYLTRICRRGVLGPRTRKVKGKWSVDSRELAAWCEAGRRKENTQEAA